MSVHGVAVWISASRVGAHGPVPASPHLSGRLRDCGVPSDEDPEVGSWRFDLMETGERHEEFVLHVVGVGRIVLSGDYPDELPLVLAVEPRCEVGQNG